MGSRPLSDETLKETIAAYKDAGFNKVAAARALKIPRNTLRSRLDIAVREGLLTEDEQFPNDRPAKEVGVKVSSEINRSEGTGVVTAEHIDIKTLDDAIRIAEIDLDVWEIYRHVHNWWDVTMNREEGPVTATNHQFKMWLRARSPQPIEDALKALIKSLPAFKGVPCKKLGDSNGDFMLELSLYDVHFGLLAWGKESLTDYDVNIASDIFHQAISRILERTGHFNQIAKILFPVGNDFFHINSPDNVTPSNKNPLDVDGRLAKVYQAGKLALIKAVDYCRKIAPVEIIWVPGNHDPQTSYFVCDTIKSFYRECDDVDVDISPRERKFRWWGNGAIGYTHGVKESKKELPLIVAAEAGEKWGAAKYREIHIGHNHRELVDSRAGVIIRTMPSLCGTDPWHYGKGFIENHRAAVGHLWDKERGHVAMFIEGVG